VLTVCVSVAHDYQQRSVVSAVFVRLCSTYVCCCQYGWWQRYRGLWLGNIALSSATISASSLAPVEYRCSWWYFQHFVLFVWLLLQKVAGVTVYCANVLLIFCLFCCRMHNGIAELCRVQYSYKLSVFIFKSLICPSTTHWYCVKTTGCMIFMKL